MIKVSVMYPNSEDVKFDEKYYKESHLPMIIDALGDNLKGIELDLGMAGRNPKELAPYVAIVHLLFDDMETFQTSFGPHAPRFEADVKNYTNIKAKLQISELVKF